jgi:hypothetical protein
MGQYRQWLHYREVDQLLRAQLETFEKELAQLQDQLQFLEDAPLANNRLMQALTRQLVNSPTTPSPTFPDSEPTQLPEDMAALFEENTQTEPQVTLPWWFREALASARQDNGQLDRQSLRTNVSVQRWRERWHRKASEPKQEDQADEQHEQPE